MYGFSPLSSRPISGGNGAAAINLSLVEAGNAVDTLSFNIAYDRQISEAGNALDIYSFGQVPFAYFLFEQVNAQDALVCSPIFNPSSKVWHILPRWTFWRPNND